MRFLQSAMKRSREFALQAYPDWSWRPPVIGAYWRLLERRAAWMPQ